MDEKKSSTSSISENSVCIVDEESCGFEFGCGKCRTKRLPVRIFNCCNCAKGMLFFLCFAVFVQGMVVNGLINIVVSTLEKRFHLRSSEMGFVASCYDLGFLLAVTVVTYVGGRGHKPQWIGWGVFVMGLGSFTFALPHFVAPAYSISAIQSQLCDSNATLQECGESHLRVYRGFFIAGHLLHGIGATGLFTLAITYLDANVKESASSVYHGIFFAFSLAGPGVGFLLGGYFIQLYTNLGETPVDADQTSIFWVGNWWLGYVVCGALAIGVSIPIIMYPIQLPNTAECREGRDKEIDRNPDALRARDDANFGKSIKDIFRSLLVVLRNVTLVCLSVAGAMDSGSVIALATFGPKYTEAMFRLTPSQAGIYFGIGSVVCACSANIIGGILVSKFNLRVKTMLKVCILCSTLTLGCFFVFLIRCDDPMVPGVNVPYNGEVGFKCEGTCGCDTKLYDPVCGADGLTYLSYCEAGCKKSQNGYVNCTRVFTSERIAFWNASTASSGKCDVNSCPSVMFAIVFASMAVFFTFLKFPPALQVSLRTVPLTQRSFAIGIQWAIMRVLGLIPLPLILGSLLDSSCLVWENVCDDCGACKLYHNASMAKYMTALFVVAKVISIAFLLIAFCTYKPPPTDHAEPQMNGHADGQTALAEFFREPIDDCIRPKSYQPTEAKSYDNKAFDG